MTGMVFIVTFPRKDHENWLKTDGKKKKRVVITDTRQFASSPLYTSSEELISINKLSPQMSGYVYTSMEQLINDILIIHKVESNACYHQIDEHYMQVIFSVEDAEKCEEILDVLRGNNVGNIYESTISVIPCSIYYHAAANTSEASITNNLEEARHSNTNTAWTRFVSSVRARLTVAQVVEVLKADATLTFDFICLSAIAAFLCAIGLVENSNFYQLSSMLISPMMGPVMAGTFGTVIGDRLLQKTGVQSELLGLGLATIVGFLYGAMICLCTNRYGQFEWPTTEMVSRGEVRNLGLGCLVALLSGAAVSVGILSDNIASLVGVAISTSLMPPAVNAGLLWSLATVYYIKGNETTRYAELTHSELYSTDKFWELTSLGCISMCLTFVNIICIYVAGILIFKLKEVAPIKMKTETRHQFWKHDIPVARDYNKSLQRDEALSLQAELRNELNRDKLFTENTCGTPRSSSSSSRVYIHKSPNSFVSRRQTLQELQGLYRTITRENSPLNFSYGSLRNSPHVMSEFHISSSANFESQTTAKKKFIVSPCNLD